MKSLILKIHLVVLFRKLVLAVSLKVRVVLKVAKESQNRNSGAAYETIFKISKNFQRSKQTLYIVFLFHKVN